VPVVDAALLLLLVDEVELVDFHEDVRLVAVVVAAGFCIAN
jgi:hypothetical protein